MAGTHADLIPICVGAYLDWRSDKVRTRSAGKLSRVISTPTPKGAIGLEGQRKHEVGSDCSPIVFRAEAFRPVRYFHRAQKARIGTSVISAPNPERAIRCK